MVVPLATAEQVPIIDISPLYEAAGDPQAVGAVAAAIRAACLHTGFFYVSGACLPSTAGIFRCMQQLFDLPDASKAQLDANLSPLHRGYTGLGGSHNCVPDETTIKGPDNKESYLLGAEGSGSPMHGPNVWPDPQQLPGWQEAVEGYFSAMLELSRVIARGLALSLSLPESFFTDKMRDPVAQLLMLRYPPPPQRAQAAAGEQEQQYVGCGAHTDCGFLTILGQSDVPGLQVKMASGEWVVAPPIQGTFVVNLGDMTARWTNDLYKSTEHRVFNTTGSRPRYSVPFFCNCDFDAVVAPADIAAAGANSKYAPITAGKYIMEKLGLMWDQDAEPSKAVAAPAAAEQ